MTTDEHSTFEHIVDESTAEYREKAERDAEREALKPKFESLKAQMEKLTAPEVRMDVIATAISEPMGGGLPLGQVIALLADFSNWLKDQGVVLAGMDEEDTSKLWPHPFENDAAEMMIRFMENLGD
jgi:hypothetical protein